MAARASGKKRGRPKGSRGKERVLDLYRQDVKLLKLWQAQKGNGWISTVYLRTKMGDTQLTPRCPHKEVAYNTLIGKFSHNPRLSGVIFTVLHHFVKLRGATIKSRKEIHMRPIYLNYNATTPIAREAAEAMTTFLCEHFATLLGYFI